MSNYYLTGEFDIADFDLRYRCTASYVVNSDGVHVTDLTLLHVAHSGYELPADHGYDPEPLLLDVRHTYQQIELEKRLRDDFEDVILDACRDHAAVNAGVQQ